MRLARSQFAAPGVLSSLARLAEIGAQDEACAAGAAWLAAELAALAPNRLKRRDAALLALRREFFAGWSANQAATLIGRSLALYAGRRRRLAGAADQQSENRLDALRLKALDAAGGRIPSARTIRAIIGSATRNVWQN